MAKLNLLRKSTKFNDKLTSYQLDLEITSSENITKYVFVKQRIRNALTNKFDDVFVAIATPDLLESLDQNSPTEVTSYFRDYKISLVGRTLEYINQTFQDILSELQKLVTDVTVLPDLEVDGIYEIEADNIDINMAVVHTHYRIPLVARPAGDNEIFEEDSIEKHRVDNQDTDLSGWLNTGVGDPSQYKFKYNIDADITLSALWPITADKIDYASIEVNGISMAPDAFKIQNDQIYWKNNLLGYAPFPASYLSPENTGDAEDQLTIVLDFIV